MIYTFKPLENTSTAFFHELFHSSLYKPPGEPAIPFEEIRKPELRRYYEYWGKEYDLGFVILQDGEEIGAVWSRRFTEEEPGFGFISADISELGIAIKKSHRGNGIGNHLMNHFLDALRERGDKQVSLSVNGDNHAAQWYERMGFKIVSFNGKNLKMVMDL